MKYQKIAQKPYCCVGACIEMILKRNHIDNQGQVTIACGLGLILPDEYKTIYPNAMFGEKPNAGYGTQIQKEEYSINHFFRQNQIDLVEEYHYITDKEKIKQFLNDNENNDIMICCYGATLYDDPESDWGHMVLFESINDENEVTILDPSHNRDYETISLETFTKAIKVHGKENGAGFYLIKNKTSV